MVTKTKMKKETKTEKEERDLFERTCYPHGLGLSRSTEPNYTHQYESAYVEHAWIAWQAARRLNR